MLLLKKNRQNIRKRLEQNTLKIIFINITMIRFHIRKHNHCIHHGNHCVR